MKAWKIVSGILSIVFFFIVMVQSCAMGVANTIEASGEVSGSAGVIVGIMMLAGGIVSIASSNGSKGGNIAIIVLESIAALVGYTLSGSYGDLPIWATWCVICGVLAVVSLARGPKKTNNSEE